MFVSTCVDFDNNVSIFFSIAVYKALYKSFGGFAADVVAAIDQVQYYKELGLEKGTMLEFHKMMPA